LKFRSCRKAIKTKKIKRFWNKDIRFNEPQQRSRERIRRSSRAASYGFTEYKSDLELKTGEERESERNQPQRDLLVRRRREDFTTTPLCIYTRTKTIKQQGRWTRGNKEQRGRVAEWDR